MQSVQPAPMSIELLNSKGRIQLDSSERVAAYSYLLGYWLGDGIKGSNSLSFSVANREQYETLIAPKLRTLGYDSNNVRHVERSYIIHVRDASVLKAEFVGVYSSLDEDCTRILDSVWFFAGALESDGDVSLHNGKAANDAVVHFNIANINLGFLRLVKYHLDELVIPSSIHTTGDVPGKKKVSGKVAIVSKQGYRLRVHSAPGAFVLSCLLKEVLSDPKKLKRVEDYINRYMTIHAPQTLSMTETFETLQGEGPLIGVPMLFLRCFTCPIQCETCDTAYSWQKGYKGVRRSLSDILDEVSKYKNDWVCLTGGEFTSLPGKLVALIALIRGVAKKKCLLITAGFKWAPGFGIINHIYLDIKPPSMRAKIVKENFVQYLQPKDSLKTIIKDEVDLQFARKLHEKLPHPKIEHTLQVFNDFPTENIDHLTERYRWLISRALSMKWKNPIRILPQLHVFIWGNKKGV